jgi:hypothetical protein
MNNDIWLVLIVGSLALIVMLLGFRMYLLLRILKILYKDYPHIYTKHYPSDQEPGILMTIKKGLLPLQIMRTREVKEDKELRGLIHWNIFVVVIQLLLLIPFIAFAFMVILAQA